MLATGEEEGKANGNSRTGATCMRHGSSDSSAKLVVGLASGHMLLVFQSETLSSSVKEGGGRVLEGHSQLEIIHYIVRRGREKVESEQQRA